MLIPTTFVQTDVPTDGWVRDDANTWTYVSATTFTVTGDRTVVFSKGTRLKLTQTTVKYFVVVGSSHSAGTTTVTITAGNDYTLANAAITSPFYSYEVNPQGYPGYFNYTPTIDQGGTVAHTALKAYFALVGRICYVQCSLAITGSGSSANLNVTLPINGETADVDTMRGTGMYNDAGTRYRLLAAVANAAADRAGFMATTVTANAYFGSDPFVVAANGDSLGFSMEYVIA